MTRHRAQPNQPLSLWPLLYLFLPPLTSFLLDPLPIPTGPFPRPHPPPQPVLGSPSFAHSALAKLRLILLEGPAPVWFLDSPRLSVSGDHWSPLLPPLSSGGQVCFPAWSCSQLPPFCIIPGCFEGPRPLTEQRHSYSRFQQRCALQVFKRSNKYKAILKAAVSFPPHKATEKLLSPLRQV